MKLAMSALFVLIVMVIVGTAVSSLTQIFNEMSLDLATWITPMDPGW